MSNGTLTAIHIHPVKSCRRVEVDRATVDTTGLAHDRQWQVVDAEGAPVTQRQQPLLATVQPSIDRAGITLEAGEHGSTALEISGAAPVTVKSLLGARVAAVDGGDGAAEWISDLLGEPCRFAAVTDSSDYRLPEKFRLWDQPLTFVDAAPVLVTNTASLDWLQQRANEPFGMERFRANLILDTDTPWVEDTWHDFTIGDARLQAQVPWPRCAIPQIDQTSGERHKEPAVVLKAHRWCTSADGIEPAWRPILEGSALFGVACVIGPAGVQMAVGDRLSVASHREPVLAPPG
ncbi:MAG: MOSC N-terminal beta barrel domain-containing protein [Actinomycetota bacterium]|jgi:uncharacterized protein|nr:MOSC N-terminal beta barrel domain-containing protein [Actinomycetota bacterium]